MKQFKHFLMLLFAAAAIVSCNEDDDNNSNPNNSDDVFSENFGSEVSRDFMGKVVDINNQPLQSVSIKIGTKTATTDINGIFIIKNADVNQQFAYIKAEKPGYINGSHAMVPTTGSNQVRIMMLPSTPTATIASGEESEVSLPSGTKVTFDGSFEDADGNPYSGSVNVSMYHLLPSNQDMDQIMPGMLYAQDQNGDERAMETFGMLHVELRGANGQKVQIAEGHTAELSMLIDPAQMASAPSTIPLWHFDEQRGYWKEDGIATRQGNRYIGDVSHFSWWNCDAPFPVISLNMTVVDGEANPLQGVGVGIIRQGQTYPLMAYTDANGNASGLVPAGETLTVVVYNYSACGNMILSSTVVGPFSSDTTIPNIVVSSPNLLSTVVEGSLVNCDGNPVTNGYVMLNIQGGQQLITEITSGAFSFNAIYCNTQTNFSLEGFDYDNLQTTDSINYTFTAPVTNVGNIIACTAITEFISYQIDDQPVVYLTTNLSADDNGGGGFTVSGWDQTQNGMYIWGGTGTSTPGTYTSSTISLEGAGIYIGPETPNTMVYVITENGHFVGEYFTITFNGTYEDESGTHTLSGTAHVLIDG